MNQHRNDDELLELLGEIFPATDLTPDARARQHLLDALALDNVAAFDPISPASRRRRRISGSRASVLTFTIAGVLSLGGVAAAAVATNTLPGPTRAFAYDMGLPVTSPALYQARSQLNSVNVASSSHHAKEARTLAKGLIKDLKLLDHQDLSQIRFSARRTLSQLGLLSEVTSILGPTVTTPTPITSTSTTSGGASTATSTSTTSTSTTTTSTTTTTTTTTPVVPLPTLPGVTSITGSHGANGVVKNTLSGASSLLP